MEKVTQRSEAATNQIRGTSASGDNTTPVSTETSSVVMGELPAATPSCPKTQTNLRSALPGRFGLEGRRPGSRHGPHLDQNVLAGYATVALASILDRSGGLFSDAARPCQRPAPPLWRKRGTRKSRLETNTENEASSALRARLW